MHNWLKSLCSVIRGVYIKDFLSNLKISIGQGKLNFHVTKMVGAYIIQARCRIGGCDGTTTGSQEISEYRLKMYHVITMWWNNDKTSFSLPHTMWTIKYNITKIIYNSNALSPYNAMLYIILCYYPYYNLSSVHSAHHFFPYSSCQLDIFQHECDLLCMDGTNVPIFQQPDQIHLWGFM